MRWVSFSLLLLAASACGDDATTTSCTSSVDCIGTDRCVEGVCRPGLDAGARDAGRRPDGGGMPDGGLSCPGTLSTCVGDCVDTTGDPRHCGGCNMACDLGAGEVCMGGTCASPCEEFETRCGTDCVDTDTDARHCGGCDAACGGAMNCVDGSCTVACTPTTPPREICDGADNDCDGTVDLPDCQPGLVAWYRFEETTGPVIDSSGNDNHGATVGPVVRGSMGFYGSAVNLDGGAGTRISVPDSASFSFGTAFSIEAWIFAEDCVHPGSNHNSVVAKETEFLFAFDTACRASNHIHRGAWARDPSAATIPQRRWTHYALVYDGARISSYLDGLLIEPGLAVPGRMSDTAFPMHIGARADAAVQTFHGRIDEVKVWNVVRSEQEVCEDAGNTYDAAARACNRP